VRKKKRGDCGDWEIRPEKDKDRQNELDRGGPIKNKISGRGMGLIKIGEFLKRKEREQRAKKISSSTASRGSDWNKSESQRERRREKIKEKHTLFWDVRKKKKKKEGYREEGPSKK